MAGEDHSSSIYSLTHNDQLWALFWTRVAALRGLEELNLSLDLGRFSFAAMGGGGGGIGGGIGGGGLLGGKRLRLAIDEPWVAPMLCVRGLKDFELGVTARCDAVAKRLIEDDLKRDAVALRDGLRGVMCSAYGEIPLTPGLAASALKICRFGLGDERRDMGESEVGMNRVGSRPRLAITAA